MELFNPIWTLVSSSWSYISKHKDYIHDLEKNLRCLKSAMEELRSDHTIVSLKVADAVTNPRMVPVAHVQDWLHKVEEIERQVNDVLGQGEEQVRNKCLGGCLPINFRLSYKIGKQVVRYIDKVNKLIDKGHFDVVAFDDSLMNSSENTTVEGLSEILIDQVVGIETTFQVAWECVCDENMGGGVIGLYGMGGVGKTTLLKTLNNELLKTRGSLFNLVIWIVASKGASVEAVQDTILSKLCVPNELWRDKGEHEKAKQVCRILHVKRFIVMLDDLWEYLDVLKIGIPQPSAQNKCKIVFTTRSEEICAQMGANKSIKVRCLTEDAALSLFQQKVGESTLSCHPDIPTLARNVAMECDGLPLALITIGRAMASRKNPYEWEHAIQVLKNYPSKFTGMADHVLGVLKFSFESLSDETIKLCFLYCSLFPEDYEIAVIDLVDLWLGEGFLDDYKGIRESRNYGMYIVETLKLACLLEVGRSDVHVKMHDVIRDMALWIACESGSRTNRFLIRQQCYSGETYDHLKEKEGVERVSIWGNNANEVLQFGRYPRLLTGLIRESRLTRFPGEFFQFTGQIKVLDLSENSSLTELPETICKLKTLQYLNISKTRVRALSYSFRKLTNLRYLLMDYMQCLEDVSAETISCLSLLRVFRMNYGHKHIPLEDVIGALENLQYINEISIYVCSRQSSKKLESSGKLQQCMRNLRIDSCGFSAFNLQSEILESLQIYNSYLKQVVIHPPLTSQFLRNLYHVIIYRCARVINLNFLVNAPNIQALWVSYCPSLKEVINEDAMIEGVTFSRLKGIRLDNLPSLACIYRRQISTPSLEQVYIFQCPLLRNIPFIPNTKQLRIITTDKYLFDGLVWDDETAKGIFRNQFKPVVKTECFDGLKTELYWPETDELRRARSIRSRTEESYQEESYQLLGVSLDM